MSKAKCLVSFERKMPDGTVKEFKAGALYDVEDLPVETVKSYFEHPELAPSRKMQTRTEPREDKVK